MGALIHLAAPSPAGPDADRVSYSVGRSLTAADFARQGRYVEARLLGLAPATPGVITGLGISPARFDSPNGTTGLSTFTIGTGSGIGIDGHLVRITTPIAVAWTDLVQAVTNGAALADGCYFLVARTVSFDGLEGPPPDPSQRTDPDPMLDIRQDSFVEVWLSARLQALPASRTPPALALALNVLVGGLTMANVVSAVGSGVPLALVLILNGQAILLSQAAGRLPADANGLNAMLLAQVRETFAMALTESGANPASAAWQASVRPRFRILPAAGELPLGLLLTPEAIAASCPFFPTGTAVYLEVVRASQVPHLLYGALDRPHLDLTSNTAQAVTLALAVPDAAWTQELLDTPRGDPVLAADIHLAYARARAAQVALRRSWIALYGGMTIPAAQAQAIGFLLGSDAAAQNLSYLIGAGTISADDLLAAADDAASPTDLLAWISARLASLTAAVGTANPPPAALPSTDAPTATQQIAALGYQVIDPEPANANPTATGHVPATSDSLLAPLTPSLPPNSNFSAWSNAVSAATPDPALLEPLIDAGIVDASADTPTRRAAISGLLALPGAGDATNDDTRPGALLELALLQLFYAVFVRVTRSYELILDAHSRLIALQRQHLDIMSTSVSSLAGGVPSDGSGLSFTRLIPFVTLTAPPVTPAPSSPPASASAAILPASTAIVATRTFSAPQAMSLSTGAIQSQAQLNPVVASAVLQQSQFNPISAALGQTGFRVSPVISESGFTQAQISPSIVANAPLASFTSVSPMSSTIASLLGRQTDIAQSVAQQIGAISQAPNFQYQPVQYATVAHITAGATLLKTAVDGVSNLRTLMSGAPFHITPQITIPGNTATDEPTRYAGIVQTTSGLLADVNQVENSALLWERGYFQFRDRILSLETRIAQQADALATARDALRSAQQVAAQAAGDYAAAQQLVLEETARVAAAVAARHQALSSATGLFYVRELATLISCNLLPVLALTADTPTDLVPACPDDHSGPPAVLQPFLDLLLEVPLYDWWQLRDDWTWLPDFGGVQRLGAMRTARLASWTISASFGSGAAAAELANLASTTRAAFEPLFQSSVSIGASLAATQQAAFSVFSLPDIVALPVSILRINAEAMRARMESTTGCLYETLTALPPSARFAWASLARAGTLPLLDFTQWPIPSGLGDAGTTALRRLAALVNWTSAQLRNGSSSASQTALGNLISAAVIAAAHGDPNDTVTGTIATTGGVPQAGIPIRVVLNRAPPIGTLLNMLDDSRNVVGTVRVQDHDAQGTTATVVTSFARTAPTSAWTIASPGGRAPWLPA